VPPNKLFIECETEGPATVQMAQQHLNGPISAYRVRWRAKAEMFSGLDGFVDSENTQLQLQLRDDRHRARRQNHQPPIGFV